METILKTNNGKIMHGDNIEVLNTCPDNFFDNCISDFPYNLTFMNKKWDTQKNFYDWCYKRAEPLFRVIKPGGYVLIFGHPKSNHRMKCAFEDAGFKIVEEIDYIYGSGFPKNQDISKMFDKKVNAKREVIGKNNSKGIRSGQNNIVGDKYNCDGYNITLPSSDLAQQWSGWKTSGLKPAHEPITVFQKPLEGKYLDNIEKYGCGAMNIDACRVDISKEDIDMINAKSSSANDLGRFPSNIILDDSMGKVLDSQSGICKSGGGDKCTKGKANTNYGIYGKFTPTETKTYNKDEGGASRYFKNINFEDEDFEPFMYCPKATKKEKGEGNIHVTVKPKKLIKWLIKLVTPENGITIDITAGSCTHGVCCEELIREEGLHFKWVDIEMMNTEEEPYCNIGKNRIDTYLNNI